MSNPVALPCRQPRICATTWNMSLTPDPMSQPWIRLGVRPFSWFRWVRLIQRLTCLQLRRELVSGRMRRRSALTARPNCADTAARWFARTAASIWAALILLKERLFSRRDAARRGSRQRVRQASPVSTCTRTPPSFYNRLVLILRSGDCNATQSERSLEGRS